ncbi:hypothetical protein F5I97DRAFT_722455 [Phlebopus sp. FC_14]|nr:hypothetical protein F5I97DRAFT_722455 [Phlebopus sp. FC_14]
MERAFLAPSYFADSVLLYERLIPVAQGSSSVSSAGDSTGTTFSVSPLTNISTTQLLSIAFPNLPPVAHLNPFVLQGYHYHPEPTACLWIEDANVDTALAAASSWPGPVSLVVVTTIEVNTTEYGDLLSRIMSNSSGANISLHLLRVQSIGSGSFNAYLNIARFFAQTSLVVLFPEGLPEKHQEHWFSNLPTRTSHPVILSNVTQKTFSLKPFAVVTLPRDYPIWCTERFFLFGSRALDWEDCLWQMWLETAGDMSSIAIPNLFDNIRNTLASPVSPQALKARRRWGNKYRMEACTLSSKRSQTIDPSTKIEKRRMQWRKRFCRETLDTAATDLF